MYADEKLLLSRHVVIPSPSSTSVSASRNEMPAELANVTVGRTTGYGRGAFSEAIVVCLVLDDHYKCARRVVLCCFLVVAKHASSHI